MTTLTHVSNQQAHAVTVNDNFEAVSASALFGVKESLTTGLTFAYYGGIIGGFGAFSVIADGTVSLTGSATNYIEATTAGVVSSNTSAFTAGRVPLYTAVTSASAITTLTDYRVLSSAFFTGGAGFATLTLARQTTDPATPSASTGIVYLKGASDAAIEAYFKRPDGTVLTLAHLEGAQTFTGALTLTAAAPQLVLGVNVTTLGSIKLFGNTSGDITLRPAAVAGTGVVITFPAVTGTLLYSGGDAGTPSALVGTNITGTAAGLTAGVASAVAGSALTGTSVSLSGGVTQTAFANATTLLTIGGTGATSVFAIPGTLEATGTTGALTVAGGVYVAKALNVAGTLAVTGAITGASYSGGAISGTTIGATTSVYAEKTNGLTVVSSVGRATSFTPGVSKSFNVVLVTAGALFMFSYIPSGQFAYAFINYESGTVSLTGGTMFVDSATPTADQIGISKSINSTTVTIKTGSNISGAITVTTIGDSVSSVTAPS